MPSEALLSQLLLLKHTFARDEKLHEGATDHRSVLPILLRQLDRHDSGPYLNLPAPWRDQSHMHSTFFSAHAECHAHRGMILALARERL